MKIIIAARIEVDPSKRAKALSDAVPVIEKTLEEPGCLHYNWAADAVNSGLISVFEEWESEATLDLHFTTDNFSKMHKILASSGLRSASATKFAVDREAPVMNQNGIASSEF